MKAMQLFQGVLQHLKIAKPSLAKPTETEPHYLRDLQKKLSVVKVRLNNVLLAPHKKMNFPLVYSSFNSCFCYYLKNSSIK